MKKRKKKDSEFIALYGIPVNKDKVKRQQEYDLYGPPIFNKKKAKENSNDEDDLDTIEDDG